MTNQENKARIGDLIKISKADGKITEIEFDFILRLAERYHVSKDEVEQFLKDEPATKKIISEADRITHFYNLILVMNVDLETHPQEIIAIRNFGLKMGIRQEALDKILAIMENYEDKVVPSKEIVSIFRTYYN